MCTKAILKNKTKIAETIAALAMNFAADLNMVCPFGWLSVDTYIYITNAERVRENFVFIFSTYFLHIYKVYLG